MFSQVQKQLNELHLKLNLQKHTNVLSSQGLFTFSLLSNSKNFPILLGDWENLIFVAGSFRTHVNDRYTQSLKSLHNGQKKSLTVALTLNLCPAVKT